MNKESLMSKVKEDILTLSEILGRPAIWMKSHGDFKKSKTVVKNYWKEVFEVAKHAYGLQNLQMANLDSIEKMVHKFQLKKKAHHTRCKQEKSGSSLEEQMAVYDVHDERVRFLSANLISNEGSSNLRFHKHSKKKGEPRTGFMDSVVIKESSAKQTNLQLSRNLGKN